MKYLSLLLAVSFFSCHPSGVKFTTHIDTVACIYQDSVQGPLKFTGIYQTINTFRPKGDSGLTTLGFWHPDTIYYAKLQSDTSPLPPHTYTYRQLNKRYVSIDPFPPHK